MSEGYSSFILFLANYDVNDSFNALIVESGEHGQAKHLVGKLVRETEEEQLKTEAKEWKS
jgi:hypothetical protein